MTNTSVSVIGTIPWTAPEYLSIRRKKERNEKGDVYSFGIIAWELVTRKFPWEEEENAEDIKEAVLIGERLVIPDSCPQHLKRIMLSCWKNGNLHERDVIIAV